MPNATCKFLSPTRYSYWQALLNAGPSIIMIFSGYDQCYQMPLLPTLMTETTLKTAHVHNWDDQCRDSNSWRINHMLGDILISTQLLVTHLVTTFLSAQSRHSWNILSGPHTTAAKWACLLSLSSLMVCQVKQSKKPCSFCFLEPLARTHRDDHRLKCRDQVTDQELVAHIVTKHMMVTTTVSVSPRINTLVLVTLTLFCFSRNLSWLCQWQFVDLIKVLKKVMT